MLSSRGARWRRNGCDGSKACTRPRTSKHGELRGAGRGGRRRRRARGARQRGRRRRWGRAGAASAAPAAANEPRPYSDNDQSMPIDEIGDEMAARRNACWPAPALDTLREFLERLSSRDAPCGDARRSAASRAAAACRRRGVAVLSLSSVRALPVTRPPHLSRSRQNISSLSYLSPSQDKLCVPLPLGAPRPVAAGRPLGARCASPAAGILASST